MTEPRRFRDMTDDELVSLIRGLPERQMRASLRDRLLAGARPARPRPGLHPAFALAALVVLLLADWLTLGAQGSARYAPAPLAALAQAEPAPREERPELAPAGLSVRLALRPAEREPTSYLAVCQRLLRDVNGG